MRSTNMNPETGIRYGTIYLEELDPEVADDLLFRSTNLSYQAALDDVEAEAAAAASELGYEHGSPDWEDYIEVKVTEAEISGRFDIEEPHICGIYEEVEYEITHLGGAALLYVTHSPRIGRFDLCSPCVPNACNLSSPNPEGFEGYTVPDDWLWKGD